MKHLILLEQLEIEQIFADGFHLILGNGQEIMIKGDGIEAKDKAKSPGRAGRRSIASESDAMENLKFRCGEPNCKQPPYNTKAWLNNHLRREHGKKI